MPENKKNVLDYVSYYAKEGLITEKELLDAFNRGRPSRERTQVQSPDTNVHEESVNLNAPQVLTYIGAVIVYAGIITVLSQSWSSFLSWQRIAWSLGSGLLLVALSIYLYKRAKDERVENLGDASLIIGSLTLIIGAFITVNETISIDSDSSAQIATFVLFILSSFYFVLDRIIRKNITIVFAILLALGSYVSLSAWIFEGTGQYEKIAPYVAMIGGVGLISAGYYFYKYSEDRKMLKDPFWSLGGFILVGSAYFLTFIEPGAILWEVIFPFIIYTAFMVSVKLRSKNFLSTGALFMVLYVRKIAFKYFGEGLGLATSLIVSGVGIIATAYLAITLRNRYFKN